MYYAVLPENLACFSGTMFALQHKAGRAAFWLSCVACFELSAGVYADNGAPLVYGYSDDISTTGAPGSSTPEGLSSERPVVAAFKKAKKGTRVQRTALGCLLSFRICPCMFIDIV